MAIALGTISGKILDASGVAPLRLEVTARAVAVNGTVKSTADNTLIAGEHSAQTQPDGSLSITLPLLPQAGVSPVDARWRATFSLLDRRYGQGQPPAPKSIEFELTGDTSWADLVDVSGTPVTESLLAAVSTARDETLQARDEAVAVGNTNDTIIASRINDPASATATSLSAAIESGIARRPLLPTLGDDEVIYVGHRFGANIVPENTAEGARDVIAQGVIGLETDTAPLSDSGVVLLHDPTVDRTTTSTGAASTFTSDQAASIVVDASAWFAPSWRNTRLMFLDDFMREFGRKAVLLPEAKNSPRAGTAIASLVDRYALHDSTMISAFTDSLVADVLLRGDMAVGYVNPAGDADFAAKRAQGYTDIIIDHTQPANLATTIAAAIAAGLRVTCYTIDRRHQAEAAVAAGAQLIITDDPVYIDPTLDARRVLTRDPYASQSPYNGMLSSNTGDAYFISPDRLGLGTLGGKQFFLQGWACPLDQEPTDTYTLTQTIAVETIGSASSQWFGMFFCASDDRAYLDAGAATENGYLLLLRVSGQMILYKRTNGAATTLASVTTAAVAQGGSATLQVQVSPTGITVTRTDTGQSITTNDAAHRGRFFHYGKSADTTGLRLSVRKASVT